MNTTRLSLYYLAGYLTFGGLSFLALPQTTLTLFFSNGNYSDVMVRLVGVLLLSLGVIVIQIIRHRIIILYKTTLIVRSIIIVAILFFYVSSRDPLMITLLVIVGLGFLLTLASYIRDSKTSQSY